MYTYIIRIFYASYRYPMLGYVVEIAYEIISTVLLRLAACTWKKKIIISPTVLIENETASGTKSSRNEIERREHRQRWIMVMMSVVVVKY